MWSSKGHILYITILGLFLSSCTWTQKPEKHILPEHKPGKTQIVTESIYSPSITTDGRGNPVIIGFVYRSFPSSMEKAPGLKVFKRENGNWLHVSDIKTYCTYSAWGHSLKVNSSGELCFAWTVQNYGGKDKIRWSAKRIATVFSSDGGRTWKRGCDVHEWKSGQRRKPKIVPAPGGIWRVFWIEGRRNEETTMTSLWDMRKLTWQAPENVEKTLTGKSEGTMRVAPIAINSRTYALIETMVENAPFTLFFASHNTATSTWKIEPFTRKNKYCRVNGEKKGDIYPLMDAGLATLPDGRLVTIVCSIMTVGLTSIMTAPEIKGHIFSYRQTEDGRWLWQNQVDDDPKISDRSHLRLLGDAQGRLYASWLDRREGEEHIYFSYSPDSGKTWTENLKITEEALKTPDYDMCLLPGGKVAFAWSDLKKKNLINYRELQK